MGVRVGWELITSNYKRVAAVETLAKYSESGLKVTFRKVPFYCTVLGLASLVWSWPAFLGATETAEPSPGTVTSGTFHQSSHGFSFRIPGSAEDVCWYFPEARSSGSWCDELRSGDDPNRPGLSASAEVRRGGSSVILVVSYHEFPFRPTTVNLRELAEAYIESTVGSLPPDIRPIERALPEPEFLTMSDTRGFRYAYSTERLPGLFERWVHLGVLLRDGFAVFTLIGLDSDFDVLEEVATGLVEGIGLVEPIRGLQCLEVLESAESRSPHVETDSTQQTPETSTRAVGHSPPFSLLCHTDYGFSVRLPAGSPDVCSIIPHRESTEPWCVELSSDLTADPLVVALSFVRRGEVVVSLAVKYLYTPWRLADMDLTGWSVGYAEGAMRRDPHHIPATLSEPQISEERGVPVFSFSYLSEPPGERLRNLVYVFGPSSGFVTMSLAAPESDETVGLLEAFATEFLNGFSLTEE